MPIAKATRHSQYQHIRRRVDRQAVLARPDGREALSTGKESKRLSEKGSSGGETSLWNARVIVGHFSDDYATAVARKTHRQPPLRAFTNPGNRPLGLVGLDRRAGLGP